MSNVREKEILQAAAPSCQDSTGEVAAALCHLKRGAFAFQLPKFQAHGLLSVVVLGYVRNLSFTDPF